jgi:hypothetical protein
MNIVQIIDHVEQAKDRLLSQMKYLPNITKKMDIIGKQIQELENVFFEIYLKRIIENATDNTLELIGENIDIPRPLTGLASINDNAYKGLIYSKIFEHISNGTAQEVNSILSLFGATKIFHVDIYPASILINLKGVLLLSIEDIKKSLIKSTLPIEIDIVNYTSNTPFGFDGDLEAHGFNDGELSTS